jgi:hypothetical protein
MCDYAHMRIARSSYGLTLIMVVQFRYDAGVPRRCATGTVRGRSP